MGKIALKIPSSESVKVIKETKSFDIYDDVGVQKIALKKDSLKAVYKIDAKIKPTFYTAYIDTKDRQRLKLKPKNELKNIKKIFATSYPTLGDKWKSTVQSTNCRTMESTV